MGRNRVTIADVARAAGVSRQTVSRVLNGKGEISEETRTRVREVIRTLGYRPNMMASGLAGGRSRNVGLVITNPADEVPSNPFFLSVIYGASTEAQHHGYGLVTKYAPAHDIVRLGESLFRLGQVDGIVILRAHSDFAAVFGKRDARDLPVILVGEFDTTSECPFLDIDNVAGSQLLTNHLLEHGYRKLAIISHSPAGHATADCRIREIESALHRRGVSLDPEAILRTNSTQIDAYHKTRQLLQSRRDVEAIVATNDWSAMAVLRAVLDTGLRVPDDIAVVGFDDLPLAAYLEPPLTTVQFSGFDLGREALRRILTFIETGVPPEPAHLSPKLVVRRSCGCPYTPLVDATLRATESEPTG